MTGQTQDTAVQGVHLPQDVIALVIAAREVVYGGHIDVAHVAFDLLDKALEAFSSSVPWENEPADPAAPTEEACQ